MGGEAGSSSRELESELNLVGGGTCYYDDGEDGGDKNEDGNEDGNEDENEDGATLHVCDADKRSS